MISNITVLTMSQNRRTRAPEIWPAESVLQGGEKRGQQSFVCSHLFVDRTSVVGVDAMTNATTFSSCNWWSWPCVLFDRFMIKFFTKHGLSPGGSKPAKTIL